MFGRWALPLPPPPHFAILFLQTPVPAFTVGPNWPDGLMLISELLQEVHQLAGLTQQSKLNQNLFNPLGPRLPVTAPSFALPPDPSPPDSSRLAGCLSPPPLLLFRLTPVRPIAAG